MTARPEESAKYIIAACKGGEPLEAAGGRSPSLHPLPRLHDLENLPRVLDVHQRIRIQDDQISELAALEGSDLVLFPHDRCGVFGCRNEDVHWTHAGEG